MNIDLETIMQILPHRPPFLFLDKVISVKPLESGTGIKLVTSGEEVVQGFYSTEMAFPGILTLEMMAQTAAVVCASAAMNQTATETEKGSGYLVSADLQCENTIVPGTVLEAKVEIIKAWGRFVMAGGKVIDGNATIAKARFTIAAA